MAEHHDVAPVGTIGLNFARNADLAIESALLGSGVQTS